MGAGYRGATACRPWARGSIGRLAVTTSSAVLLNVAAIDGTLDLAELLALATAQRGEVFVGVVLGPTEVRRFVRDVGVVLRNVTVPIVGARLDRNK